jgi:hypothetical protein
VTNYQDRINEYFSNGYPINDGFDYGTPLLNDYKNKTGVMYFSDFSSNSADQSYGGYL